ncbi:unnamed protein product [Peronospora belbahrii]|uniref:FAD-binding domain-containing protein n=1 Tax=Peronospora belbahrii TaxID=622444 RepID=A0AAU9LI27_9STRA|nr:unnamed protein product [Peronospora belbahrii]
MVQNSPRDFDIAIVCGGITGVTLAVGLVRANIPVTLYESAKALGEIGAGVALAANAARALELLAPDAKYAFDRVGSDVNDGSGDLITSVPTPAGSAYVHRAHFLDEMIKLVPEGVTKFNKRLDDIETLPDVANAQSDPR